MLFKPKTIDKKYYIKTSTISGNILIIEVEEETEEKLPEVRGKVVYSKNEPRKVGLPWQEKKCNMIGSNYEFSKKGFPIPEPEEIPYTNLVSIPPLGPI